MKETQNSATALVTGMIFIRTDGVIMIYVDGWARTPLNVATARQHGIPFWRCNSMFSLEHGARITQLRFIPIAPSSFTRTGIASLPSGLITNPALISACNAWIRRRLLRVGFRLHCH